MSMTGQPQTDRPDPSVIAAQNDAFRKLACLGVPTAQSIQGRMHVTRSIMSAGDGFMAEAVKATGKACVIQVVSTGESLLKRRLETMDPEDELVEGELTPRDYVLGYLEQAFPIHAQKLVEIDGNMVAEPLRDETGALVVSREALALRDAAMMELMTLAPIPSALDQILWAFGDDAVAEVTGRSIRPLKADDVFGLTLTNSAGRDIPVRWIGEQHVREDCQGRIPSMADWLRRIQPEPWMANGHIDSHAGSEPCGDPRAAWASEVAAGRTVLGLKDWMAAHATQATQGA